MYYIGLMSGTSADAVDAALLHVQDGQWKLGQTHREPMPTALRQSIHQLCASGDDEIERMGRLGVQLGKLFASAAVALLKQSCLSANQIRAIGSHGQTIRHVPDGDNPFTLQIGEPSIIAEETGITTVAHFRNRDIAAGGQGAPLVPAFHHAVFRSPTITRTVVNIGGIANISFLPSNDSDVIGFDTGPGNCLLDQWIEKHHHARFDRNGEWANHGTVDAALLETLLGDEYFSRPAPKSTGRELFNLGWLQRYLENHKNADAASVQATLLQLTARSVANSISQLAPAVQEVYVCGGGARNGALMTALRAALPKIRVGVTDTLGIPGDWVEAAAFAWLAHRALEGSPGNLPSVTGARHSVVLGAIYPP